MDNIASLAARLAAAHIGHHPTKAEEVPDIIKSIGDALLKVTAPAPAPATQAVKKRGPVEARKTRTKAATTAQESAGDHQGTGGNKGFQEALAASRQHFGGQREEEPETEAHPS